MPYVLNSETAKIAAQKSIEARRRYAVERKQAAMLLEAQEARKIAEAPVKPPGDPYIDGLACAQVEYLAKLRKCSDARDAAALSQTLKNLRETYHMATGLAKPGVRKPERISTRQQSSQQSSGPELPPDATSGSGSASQ